jgi:hypothetical protein
MTVEEQPKRRSAAQRFGDLSDRLSRTFNNFDRPRPDLPAWVTGEDPDYPDASETVAWSPTDQRFPVVRNGYDCVAVDQELSALERELTELKAHRASTDTVAAEIDRIGTQTAAVLQAAYEQAAEITREARHQADKCLADAAANAVEMTEDANRRLRELDVETDSVWQERSRLIDDARGVATQLFALADDAAARFPTESEKPDQRGPQFPHHASAPEHTGPQSPMPPQHAGPRSPVAPEQPSPTHPVAADELAPQAHELEG